MKKCLLFFTLFLLSFVAIHAQERRAISRPTPPPESDVVKISTNLIQVDVTVTDKNGNAVRDLRPDEIEIYENGKLQKVNNFSFVPGNRTTSEEAAKLSKENKRNSPNVILPSGPIRPEQVRRTIALVVDDLNLSFGSTAWVQDALKKFVNEQMQDGDLVAIIRTGAGVGALQQFTSDKRQLLAAIERVRFNMAGSANLAYFNPLNTSVTQRINTAEADPGSTPSEFDIEADQDISQSDAFEKNIKEFRENIFASGTLGALNFVVRGMKTLPGRKSVLLISDGLPLLTRDSSGRPELSRIYQSLKYLIDFANRSSVVFYAIHAPGLVVPMFSAEEDLSGVARVGGENSVTNIRDRINKIDDDQAGLRYIADETGGLTYFNQNDIGRGIRRVLDDQSYYLVGYEPDDAVFNDKERKFNKLEIKVKREGTKVRYRSGFFGIAEEQLAKPKLSVTDTLIEALTSPFGKNEIAVRMNAIFAGDEKQGAFVRSFINVDAATLTFTKDTTGKFYSTSFDIVAITFGDNGKILDERSKNFTITLDQPQYEKFQERGLVTTFSLPIKNPGGYQVRLALRDVASDRVGSANQYVEIPNLKKDKLAVSGMVLENVSTSIWNRVRLMPASESSGEADPQWDTAVRQFRRNSVMRFAYQVYNPRGASGAIRLAQRLTLFTGGKVVFQGPAVPVSTLKSESPKSFAGNGALFLGDNLPSGDYILQVDISDLNGKSSTATQFIQFEIVD
ncbi:MAG: VWA domain-containing protein [Pyrinomonadaceae bacterium]|nr:VWA domain-containing protein [Pyrinomonadaceae bacterium]